MNLKKDPHLNTDPMVSLCRALNEALPPNARGNLQAYRKAPSMAGHWRHFERFPWPLHAFIQDVMSQLPTQERSTILQDLLRFAERFRREHGLLLSQRHINEVYDAADRAFGDVHFRTMSVLAEDDELLSIDLKHLIIASTLVNFVNAGKKAPQALTAKELGLSPADINKAVLLIERKFGLPLLGRSEKGQRTNVVPEESSASLKKLSSFMPFMLQWVDQTIKARLRRSSREIP